MSKLILTAAASVGLAAALALPASPALAQRAPRGQIIVYGTDPCPRSTDDDVVVCYRRPEAERFRIPEVLRQTGTLQQGQSWAKRAEGLTTIGSVGLTPCSPVGPMGVTGCAQQEINRAFRDLREGEAAQTAPVR
jgi:hypothetical protein